MLVRQSYNAATVVLGGQSSVSLGWLRGPFQASVLVDIVSGAANYAVEFTTDDITGDQSKLRWLTDTGVFASGKTETSLTLVETPIVAVRLNITSLTGEIRFTVLQTIPK